MLSKLRVVLPLAAAMILLVVTGASAFFGASTGHLKTTTATVNDNFFVMEDGDFELERGLAFSEFTLDEPSMVTARFTASTRCIDKGIAGNPKTCSVHFVLDNSTDQLVMNPDSIIMDSVGDGRGWDSHTAEATLTGVPAGDYQLTVEAGNPHSWFAVGDRVVTVEYGPQA